MQMRTVNNENCGKLKIRHYSVLSLYFATVQSEICMSKDDKIWQVPTTV